MLRRPLAILLVVLLAGGHLAVLQAVAWTTMFAAQVGVAANVVEAARATFDGEHPCRLCLAVDQLATAAVDPGLPSPKAVKVIDKAPLSAVVILVPDPVRDIPPLPVTCVASVEPGEVETPPPQG